MTASTSTMPDSTLNDCVNELSTVVIGRSNGDPAAISYYGQGDPRKAAAIAIVGNFTGNRYKYGAEKADEVAREEVVNACVNYLASPSTTVYVRPSITVTELSTTTTRPLPTTRNAPTSAINGTTPTGPAGGVTLTFDGAEGMPFGAPIANVQPALLTHLGEPRDSLQVACEDGDGKQRELVWPGLKVTFVRDRLTAWYYYPSNADPAALRVSTAPIHVGSTTRDAKAALGTAKIDGNWMGNGGTHLSTKRPDSYIGVFVTGAADTDTVTSIGASYIGPDLRPCAPATEGDF